MQNLSQSPSNNVDQNHIRMKLSKSSFGQYEVVNIDIDENNHQLGEKIHESREQNMSKKDNVKELNNSRNQNTQVISETDCEFDNSEEQKAPEIKVEVRDEVDYAMDNSNINIEEINKWWLQCQKSIYTNNCLNGPKIFLPTDSVEFTTRVSETFKKHQNDKKELDQK